MVTGSTNVHIGNGTIGNGSTGGNVYGGGEIGRVESNTVVMIGAESGTSAPDIKGDVFGAGSGTNTHGYSALVRGNSTVTVQANAKVGKNVYGGGEIASVGRYVVVNGLPTTPDGGGKCTVTIQGNAEIGPDNMTMTADGGPVNLGHVFGAGKGVLPYENVTGTPWSSIPNGQVNYENTEDGRAAYFNYIKTLALASETDVTVAGDAFIKGSVYGGSQNGRVQTNTLVKIQGGQIGAGGRQSVAGQNRD